MEDDTKTEIFVSVLFYYFIKRKYLDKEFHDHKKRFYDVHNQDYKSMKCEFDICWERERNNTKKYDEFINLPSIADRDTVFLYIYFFLYCRDDVFYDSDDIERYYDYIQRSSSKCMSILDNYSEGKFKFKDNKIVKIKNDEENIIKILKPVYFVKYDAHSGHVFAYLLQFIKELEGTDYVIAITEDYYIKQSHVIELYKMYRGDDAVVILCNNSNYEMGIKELPFHYNYLYECTKLFVTNDFLFVEKNDFEEKTINGINLIISNADKSTIKYSCHIDIINECIKKCNDKHKNTDFHKNIFLVKNNKKTPFNNTPARGFNLDNIDSILQNNYIKIDPQEIEISLLVYFLNNAENIITSWSTIMYINKFFFNKKSKVIVLCHKDYEFEYDHIKNRHCDCKKHIYFADVEELYYIQDLDTDSINETFLNNIINILK